MNILIVDDDVQIARVFKRWFDRGGLTSGHVRGVEEAVRYVQLCAGEGVKIDLVISDVDMPDGSGFELADRLSVLPRAPQFVFMTASPEKWKELEAARLGADLFDKMDLAHVARSVEKVAALYDSPEVAP